MAMEKIGLKAVMDDANFVGGMTRYLTGINTMNAQTGLAATGMGGALAGVGSAVLKMGTIIAGTGVAAVGALATAMGAGIVAGTKAAISVESAFAGIIKTTDGLVDSYGNLNETGKRVRQNFIDLSEEIPVTVEELMKIGELGGQLGIAEGELLDFTKVVAALGVSTNLYGDEAATTLARIANVMGTSQEDFSRLGSSIVALGNNFATTEAEITHFAQRVAGAGSVVGLTEADILGIGAAFTSVGVQSEAGGTAVQKVLLAMHSAVKLGTDGVVDNSAAIGKNSTKLEDLQSKLRIAQQQQAEFTERTKESTRMAKAAQIDSLTRQIAALSAETEALGEVQGMLVTDDMLGTFARVAGVTVAEFRDLWERDAGEAFTRFVEGLEASGDDAIAILEELELTDVRLVRGFLSVSNAGDLMRRSMQLSAEAWEENVALQKEADQRYKTTESQLTMLKNTFRNLGVTVGAEVLPFLNELVLMARPIIKELAGELPQVLETSLKPALQGILETGGEFLMWLGENLPAIIQAALPILQGLVQGFLDLTVWLGTNLPPAVAAAQGFFADVGAVIAEVIEKVQGFVEAAQGPIMNLVTTSQDVASAMEEPLARARELIDTVMGDIIPWAHEQLGGLLTFLQDVFGQVAAWFVENEEVISNTLISLRQIWEAVWPHLRAVLETAIADWKLAVQTGMAFIQNILKAIMLAIQGDWAGAWEHVVAAGRASLEGFWGTVQNTLNLVLGFFGTSLAGVRAAVQEWAQGVADTILDWVQSVVTFFIDLRDATLFTVRQWFYDMGLDMDEMLARWGKIFADLWAIAERIFELIVQWVSDKIATMVLGVETGMELIGQVWGLLWDNVYSKIYEIGAQIVETVVGFITDAYDAIFGQKAEFETVGGGLMEGLIQGVKSYAGSLIKAATGVIEDAIGAAKKLLGMESPSRVFYDIGANIVLGLVKGIDANADSVMAAIEAMLDVGGALAGLGGGFASAFEHQALDPLKKQLDAATATVDGMRENWARYTAERVAAATEVAQADIAAIKAGIAERIGAVEAEADARKAALKEDTAERIAAIREEQDAREEAVRREFDERAIALGRDFDDRSLAVKRDFDERAAALKASIEDEEALTAALLALDDEERAAKRGLEDEERAAKQALADEEATRIKTLQDAETARIDAVRAEELAAIAAVEEAETTRIKAIRAEEEKLIAVREEALARQIKNYEEQVKHDWILRQAEAERNRLMEEYEKQQERVTALEEQRAKLQFLQEQAKLLDLIATHGLDAGEILQGITLGVDADAGALLDAMARAVEEIVRQTSDQVRTAGGDSTMDLFSQTAFATAALAAGVPGLSTPSLSSPLAPIGTGGAVVNLNFGDVHLNSDLDVNLFLAQVKQTVAEAIA